MQEYAKMKSRDGKVMIDILYKIMVGHGRFQDASIKDILEAAKIMLDRSFGPPPKNIKINVDIDRPKLTDEELQALAQLNQPQKVIEGEVISETEDDPDEDS